MPKIEFDVETTAPPEKVLEAGRDFSDRRPDIWPGISREYYEVHETGPGFAEVTEGGKEFGGVWARERYEWAEGSNKVTGTVVDSNIFKSGVWEMTVEPRDGGGSRVHVLNHRQMKGKGRLISPILMVVGKRLLAKTLKEDTLSQLE
ncbi:MAG: hypothetical protein QOJ29_4104 [Thermoleophilaceae bacterium]|jgi:hypothetical protein|nr:hypothetical protein [Thermoleophilaceae bacterium]